MRRYASRIIVDGYAFTAGETQSADTTGLHTPAVCVSLDDLGGLTDETITIEIVGKAGTYVLDERTISSAQTYIVDAPQADQIQITSTNGSTITAEARNNPR